MWADAQRDGRPAICGAVCESSLIPFLVPCRKLWLTFSARVPCSNSAIVERKTWTQSEFCTWQNFRYGHALQKCIYNVPAQETAKHREKFG